MQCVHMLVHTRVHTLDTRVCTHSSTHTCVHTFIHCNVCACSATHVCACTLILTRVHMLIHTHVHTLVLTYECTCTLTGTHPAHTPEDEYTHTNVRTQEHPRSMWEHTHTQTEPTCVHTHACTQAWGTAGSLSQPPGLTQTRVCKAPGPRQGSGLGGTCSCVMPAGRQGDTLQEDRAPAQRAPAWAEPGRLPAWGGQTPCPGASRHLGSRLLAHPGLLTQPVCHRINIYWIFPARPQS